MNLLTSFRSEILKTRRTATFYFTVIASALVPCISLLAAWLDGPDVDPGEDPFTAILRLRFNFLCGVIFPMYIMLVCTLLAQMEYRNNTWKQVFTSPQSKLNIFIARFLNVHVLVILFLLLYNILLVISLLVIHFMLPALHLLNKPHWSELITWNVNTYVSALALIAVQFWLGLRFRNFIVPLGIGLTLWLIGVMMVAGYHVPNAYIFPYTYTAYTAFPKNNELLPAVQWGSVVYMVVFLVLGFVDFRRGRR